MQEMDLAKAIPAYDGLGQLLKKAEEVRALFDAAGLEYPEPLRRMLSGGTPPSSRTTGPEGRSPGSVERPLGVAKDWIDVPIDAIITQTAVLGILRGAAGRPISTKQIVSELDARGIAAREGSVANIGARFEVLRVIERVSGEGWKLIDYAKAPILNGTRAWGHPEMFGSHELAARRREAILKLLSEAPSGLQNVEIARSLEAMKDLKTPASTDLVKTDMHELYRASKVRRRGDRRWLLAGTADGPNLFSVPTLRSDGIAESAEPHGGSSTRR